MIATIKHIQETIIVGSRYCSPSTRASIPPEQKHSEILYLYALPPFDFFKAIRIHPSIYDLRAGEYKTLEETCQASIYV